MQQVAKLQKGLCLQEKLVLLCHFFLKDFNLILYFILLLLLLKKMEKINTEKTSTLKAPQEHVIDYLLPSKRQNVSMSSMAFLAWVQTFESALSLESTDSFGIMSFSRLTAQKAINPVSDISQSAPRLGLTLLSSSCQALSTCAPEPVRSNDNNSSRCRRDRRCSSPNVVV